MQHRRQSLRQWSKPKRKNARAAVKAVANVIVVSAVDAAAAETAMTAATAATVVVVLIAESEKIVATAQILRSVMAVARLRKTVKQIANNATPERRKLLSLRAMQPSTVRRIRQPPRGHHVSPEKPVSHASHVLIAVNVVSAASAARVASAVTGLSVRRATATRPIQHPQPSCR